MENELGSIYQEISDVLYAMIPESWDKIVLYAEIGEGHREVFFFYYPEGKNTPVYSLNITDLFKADRAHFRKLQSFLYDWFEEMRNVFKRHDQQPWTNLTLSLDKNGKLNIQFDYDDLSEIDTYEQFIIWKYKHLGIQTEGARAQRILEDYLQNQE